MKEKILGKSEVKISPIIMGMSRYFDKIEMVKAVRAGFDIGRIVTDHLDDNPILWYPMPFYDSVLYQLMRISRGIKKSLIGSK